MPKERRDRRSSKNADENNAKTKSLGVENEKEWGEASCPACMEHPHNAVLLICSSHEKGCRPYMCDTSSLQSNCLHQFLKLTAANKSSTKQLGENLSEHVCPLCRGKISKWAVMEPARQYMNSKTRSCALETCDFVGNYSEIRKHARCVHHKSRPMEMDPARQLDWERLERQIVVQDLDSFMESGDESDYEVGLFAPHIGSRVRRYLRTLEWPTRNPRSDRYTGHRRPYRPTRIPTRDRHTSNQAICGEVRGTQTTRE